MNANKRMKAIKLAMMLVHILVLSSCASGKLNPVNERADYGTPPTNYKDQLQTYWKTTLKDPGSLQIENIGAPSRAYVYSSNEKPHVYDLYSDVTFEPVYGHVVCARINAKNSYGAYTGYKTEGYFFDRSGKMSTPIYMPENMMTGMHRTGSMPTGTIVVPRPLCN